MENRPPVRLHPKWIELHSDLEMIRQTHSLDPKVTNIS